MTDSSGIVVWSADYKPFGEATITVSTITNNLRFPGQYFDVETGLNYNYFRDYNPIIGRYAEADPIGQRGGLNLYRYSRNNALKFIDPFGTSELAHVLWELLIKQFINMAWPDPVGRSAEDEWGRQYRLHHEFDTTVARLEKDIPELNKKLDQLIADMEKSKQWEIENDLRVDPKRCR